MYDVIVIGGGPAGITASIYAKRRKLSVLVISKQETSLFKAEKIENYYGFPQGISGEELYNNGIKQAKNLGIDIIEDEVVALSSNEFNEKKFENESDKKIFEIETVNSSYQAKAVILATGSNRLSPNIKGIQEFEGKGVSYCAICDAFFYKGKDVAVLGSGNYAIHEMQELKPIVNSVTILTNGDKIVENRDIDISKDKKVQVIQKKVKEFRGDSKIQEVEFEDKTKKNVQGVFVAIATASSNDLARKIGARIENGHIITDENMETTVKGLFACGDCTGGLLQISKAVYEGTLAGLAVRQRDGVFVLRFLDSFIF